MKIQGKRYNHYRDMTNWKPFHHDAAALDKKGRGKPMHLTQNMTVGVSFGEARQAGFEWAGSRERCSGGGSFPEHLLSPPVNGGRGDKNIVSCAIIAEICVAFPRNLSDDRADRSSL